MSEHLARACNAWAQHVQEIHDDAQRIADERAAKERDDEIAAAVALAMIEPATPTEGK